MKKLKFKIGMMGSALEKKGDRITKKAEKLAFELGKEIARHNAILINGACYGIPYIASKGAKAEGGMVIGVSPAENLQEHVHKYRFPVDSYDILFYTGFGFKGRNVVNVSNSDAIIIVSGRVGTLNEFTIGYDEGMVIGVMRGSGGIADSIEKIVQMANKNTGSRLIYETNPHELIKKILLEIAKKKRHKGSLKEVRRGSCESCSISLRV